MHITTSSLSQRVSVIPRRFATGIMALSLASQLGAQQADMAAISRIKDEGFNRSQVMDITSWLTDVHGPRLTNSPNMRAAANYALTKFREWGLANPHYHNFNFGRGWANEKTYLQVVSPNPYPVLGFPSAWSVGTNGLVRGEVVIVDAPTQMTPDHVARYRGQLRGKIVLPQVPPNVSPMFTPPGRRHTVEQLDALAVLQSVASGGAGEPPAAAGRAGGDGGRGGRGGGRAGGDAGAGRGGRAAGAAGAAAAPEPVVPTISRTQFILDEGVAAVLTPGASRGNSGSVAVSGSGSRAENPPPSTPAIAVSAEHYGRMYRQVERGVPVVMEMDVRNAFTGNDLNSMNIIAEIPGTDKRDEIVMIGAHFDSWHSATGATDNGCSSATMMEVMRILKTTGVPLRRTVRIGLWTGEEQGLIGSREYVATQFAGRGPAPAAPAGAPPAGGRGGGRGGGGPLELKPEFSKFSLYLNQDNGCGAIRGIYTQGNQAAVPVFQDWFRLIDSDSITARHISTNSTGSTDHASFHGVGLPGFQFIQDPMEYGSRTHHSSQDFYERLVPTDMRHNSVAIAILAYMAANRAELFPRIPQGTPGGMEWQ